MPIPSTKVRRGERTDLVYLDHITKRRSRSPLLRLFQWLKLQLFGETRRRADTPDKYAPRETRFRTTRPEDHT
jgi:hypothetical protein